MLDSMEKARRSRQCILARARHWPVVAQLARPLFGGRVGKANTMWKSSKGHGRRWIDAHKDQKVGMRVMAGPDIIGTITRHDKDTVVLEVSGTPTSLLVSRDKIVMLYVIHEHATGARDDGGSPA